MTTEHNTETQTQYTDTKRWDKTLRGNKKKTKHKIRNIKEKDKIGNRKKKHKIRNRKKKHKIRTGKTSSKPEN